jgi:hypothetical protein
MGKVGLAINAYGKARHAFEKLAEPSGVSRGLIRLAEVEHSQDEGLAGEMGIDLPPTTKKLYNRLLVGREG